MRDYYTGDIVWPKNYYPFGMTLPGRSSGSSSYRYGMNGQEREDEIANSNGAHYSAEYWMYDSRLGRRWNLDPIDQVSVSNYATFGNNPILFADHKGDSIRVPEKLFDPSPVGPYQDMYNSNGFNEEDWNTMSTEIYEVTGITLKEPERAEKNLEISSIDESIGSPGARSQYKSLIEHPTRIQQVKITNGSSDVFGAEVAPSYQFSATDGKLVNIEFNKGIMSIDLDDFRKWRKINTENTGTADHRVLGFGFAFLHEYFHNRGIGANGLTLANKGNWDLEMPVIEMVNKFRIEMNLPTRLGHTRLYDEKGGYIPFSDNNKFYVR